MLAKEINTFATSGGALAEEKLLLGKALEDVNAIMGTLVGFAMESQNNSAEIYKAGLQTSRLLMSVGETIIAWLLLRQADIAIEKSASPGRDADFYAGKIAAAKFFIRTVLPHLAAERIIVEAENGSIMEIAETAF